MSDPATMAQHFAVANGAGRAVANGAGRAVATEADRAAATGARRLSAVNGSFWPEAEQSARPAGAPVRQADPTSSARLRGPRALTSGLSARERTVLSLLADGCSTREIAGELCYSERTIKNVLQEITSRLQLRNRTQAVAYAVRRGWI